MEPQIGIRGRTSLTETLQAVFERFQWSPRLESGEGSPKRWPFMSIYGFQWSPR